MLVCDIHTRFEMYTKHRAKRNLVDSPNALLASHYVILYVGLLGYLKTNRPHCIFGQTVYKESYMKRTHLRPYKCNLMVRKSEANKLELSDSKLYLV